MQEYKSPFPIAPKITCTQINQVLYNEPPHFTPLPWHPEPPPELVEGPAQGCRSHRPERTEGIPKYGHFDKLNDHVSVEAFQRLSD